jgi:hypothetical protein
VVHFVGHGDFDRGRGTGVLALVGEDGQADLVPAGRVAELLRQARPVPRVILLDSRSASRADHPGSGAGHVDLFAGTATALARCGVTAVAAMQFQIGDRAAFAFSRAFYAALADGLGVDEAVSGGRAAVVRLGGRSLEWVAPVLCLRGTRTRLFTFPTLRVPGPSSEGLPGAGVPSRPIRTLSVQGGWRDGANAVAFHPDGTSLASGGSDRTVRIRHAQTGRRRRTITGPPGEVNAVVFSPDGILLAAAGHDRAVRIWSRIWS